MPDFRLTLGQVRYFFAEKPKRFFSLVSIVFLVIALPFAVFLIQQVQDFRKMAATTPPAESDWWTLGANPERTSWVSEEVRGDLDVEWYRPIEPYIPYKVQPIATNGRIYVSTSKGLYAFNATSGNVDWVFPTELPLGHSPTVINVDGRATVFVGGLDHKIYAIDANSGQAVPGYTPYEAEAGFDTNPLVVNGTIFAGNRDGYFYALDAGNGSLRWRYKTDGPISYSAAYKNGIIYFASNDAFAYALREDNGTLIWKSAKLPGGGFLSQWPVIYTEKTSGKDYVIFSGAENYRNYEGDASGLIGLEEFALYPGCQGGSGGCPSSGTLIGSTSTAPSNDNYWTSGTQLINGQRIADHVEDHQDQRLVFFLDTITGQEYKFDSDNDGKNETSPFLWSNVTYSGSKYPPVVNKTDGIIYSTTYTASSGLWIPRGDLVGWKMGSHEISRVTGDHAVDEPEAFAGGGKLIYWSLLGDREAGAFDVTMPFGSGDRTWGYYIYNLINQAPDYDPMYNDGTGNYNVTQGWQVYSGAHQSKNGVYGKHGTTQSPPIPYRGMVYMLRGNTLMAWKPGTGAGNHLSLATIASAPQAQSSLTAAGAQQKLESEIQKMINAGHLRPGYFSAGMIDSDLAITFGELMDYFQNPSDTVVTLTSALPYLSTNLQNQVRTYLQANYGPSAPYSFTNFNHIGWQNGAAREPYGIPPEIWNSFGGYRQMPLQPKAEPLCVQWGDCSFYTGMNPYNFYAGWKYAQVFNNASTILSAMNGKLETPPQDSVLTQMPFKLNAYIAGYQGYLELQKLAGQAESSTVRNTYNRLLNLRVSGFTKDTPWPSSLSSDDAGNAYKNTFAISRNFIYMTPELGDYLNQHALSQFQGAISEYQYIAPYWLSQKYDNSYGEGTTQHLYDSPSIFQAKAYILKDPYNELVKWLDVPAFTTGDLFYIQNLTALLKSSNTPITPTPLPTTNPTPTLVPTPTPTPRPTITPTPTPHPTIIPTPTPPIGGSGDLAQGKPVVRVSSTASGSSPVNAVDGNDSTFWTSASGGEQTIGVDLGSVYSLNNVIFKWGQDYSTYYYLELSNDGQNWSTVWTITNGSQNDNLDLSGEGKSARFVGLKTSTGINSARYQLASLEVYSPLGSITPSPIPTPTSLPTLSLSPTPTPTPCNLSTASWVGDSIGEGQNIMMNIQASGNCVGQTVNLEVRRNITLQPDQPSINSPSPNPVSLIQVSPGNYSASSTWKADPWLDGCGLFSTCDSEYFFKANIVGETKTIESDPRLISVTQTTTGSLSIANITDNRSTYSNSQIPKYEKFEINFNINNTVATNFNLPYEANPPTGVTSKVGITVNAEFSKDNFTTVYTQPAFYYQDFDYQNKSGREWFYPNGNFSWKVRFSPSSEGSWQYRLSAQDSSGLITTSPQSFTVTSSSNHGFIRASKNDSRYFEFDDGTYFPGLGYNMNYDQIQWDNPVTANQNNFQIMKQNGIQLVRMWLSQWGIFSSNDVTWASMRNGPDDAGIDNRVAYPNSDNSMALVRYWQPCMSLGAWKEGPAIKPNTKYKVFIRYNIPQLLPAAVNTSQPRGLVAKLGPWLEPDACSASGTGTAVTGYASNQTSGWAILEGTIDTANLPSSNGSTDFLNKFYLTMENVNHSSQPASGSEEFIFINRVEIREDLGDNQCGVAGGTGSQDDLSNGKCGVNIVSRPSMSYLQYFDQKYSYAFDKVLDLAKQNDIYFKVVGLEKNENLQNSFDFSGNPIFPPDGSNQYFYGNWGQETKIYWYQKAWWRYLQARWGYSPNIHSWELLNEGDPYNGQHYTLADNFAKYMHQFTPNQHLVTTSLWTNFPKDELWTNPNYTNLDYADIHRYIYDTDPEFNDSAAAVLNLSMSIGAKTSGGANKPTMRGETGFVEDGNTDHFTSLFSGDTQGIWLHKFIWAQINSGGVLDASYWFPQQHIYPSGQDYRVEFGRYYNFIKDVPLNNGSYQDLNATVSNQNIRVLGQKDTILGRAHLWVDNKNHTWKNVVDNMTITPVSGTVTIGSMPVGNYTAIWVNPYTGLTTKTETVSTNSLGIINFTITNLSSDLAIKIQRQGIPTIIPTPTPVPLPGDINNDGIVNLMDYNLLVTDFGKTGAIGFSPADVNQNGKVDIFDFNLLVENFGKSS